MLEYTYRTFNLSPSDYERDLSNALFSILGKSVHDPEAIVAELNQVGPRPMSGLTWSRELLESEARRLGTWTNSIGGPVGTHSIPGVGRRSYD